MYVWDKRCERALYKLGGKEEMKTFSVEWNGTQILSGGESGKLSVYSVQ